MLFFLSGAVSQSKQGLPDFPHPRHVLQLLRWDPKVFPVQPRDIVPPLCPGSGDMSKTPPPESRPGANSAAPLDVEDQRLYSELLILSLREPSTRRRKLIWTACVRHLVLLGS
ncbi:hypothetical protein NQD34_004732 [Periophthalmus magnuspinnatus]|nr:hypothetical protein NQD34_004732 [Periophthalmus magnuspinnatus]